jgi:N utilization substance protein B
MAAAELLYFPDVPGSAAINEAVELAKDYGTAESGKFVNGILGALARREDVAEAKNGV